MAERVVAAQRQAAQLLGVRGLQAVVVAVRSGLELGDVSESLVQRLLVGIWSEASVAHVLIAVELHLVGFVRPRVPT